MIMKNMKVDIAPLCDTNYKVDDDDDDDVFYF
jgi:hypothetical protein